MSSSTFPTSSSPNSSSTRGKLETADSADLTLILLTAAAAADLLPKMAAHLPLLPLMTGDGADLLTLILSLMIANFLCLV